MQLNPAEMGVLAGAIPNAQTPFLAFQLPTIHAAVPRSVEITDRRVDLTPFARALLDAGVIDPEKIDLTACSPRCIIEQGLRAWFKERTDGMKYLKFDVHVFDADTATNIFKDYYLEEPPEFNRWVLAFEGDGTDEVRCAEPIAREIEKKCPGLFYTAFSAMEHGSWLTTDVLTPINVIEQTASHMLWEGDLSEMPSDEDAMPFLIDRYGDEVGRYLPSELMKVWGQGFCFPRKGQKAFGKGKLKKLAGSRDKLVAKIARQVLKLQDAKNYVEECGAKMPWHERLPQPLHTACSIGFNRDDRYTEWVDEQINTLGQSGEYMEFLSIGEIPDTVDELDSYFIKLDALLRLMAEVDAFIPLLSIGNLTE